MELDQIFNIKLLPQLEEDISRVLEVYRQCEDFLALGPQPTASTEMVLKDIRRCLTGNGVFYGIFLDESEMIGVLDIVPREIDGIVVEAYIERLMIAPGQRRKGIGRQVLRAIEANIKNKTGVTLISISVQTNNPEALEFWQNNGYVIFKGPELEPNSTTVYHLKKDLGQAPI